MIIDFFTPQNSLIVALVALVFVALVVFTDPATRSTESLKYKLLTTLAMWVILLPGIAMSVLVVTALESI